MFLLSGPPSGVPFVCHSQFTQNSHALQGVISLELYIHIPFCRSKCAYCDFPSFAGCEAQIPRYITAVLAEARQRAEALGDPEIETVFIGGGTPSLLPAAQLERLLNGLHSCFRILPGAEFTCEANPGTLTADWLDTAVRGGMNRLSMGMQAAQPGLLRLLGRIHTMEDVCASVRLARQAGVADLNLDLMFGLPGQTPDDWRASLEAALALAPQHLSCYGLIPEEGTPLAGWLENGTVSLPEEETEREMYDTAIRTLAEHGFAQYEISNFARPGHACRHNLGYWRQVPYLGLGSSAASMLPDPSGASAYLRSANPPLLADYLAGKPAAVEPVSRREAMFETMMLGLRTTEGVSETAFRQMHGVPLETVYGARLKEQIRLGLVSRHDGRYALTRAGMDLQNTVLVALMDD